jgi:2-phosphosulfolactate phosphatase
MPKLHVLTNKAEIKKEKINDKIVIVLDILIATSSIVTALANGCKTIIPVRNYEEALELQKQLQKDGYKFSGELNADTLPGFIQPTPIALLKAGMEQTQLVYCTTNGTVALKDCKEAKRTFVGSLLNAKAIIAHIHEHYPQDNVLIVCAGSNDQFNIEDFYGAGYFVDEMLKTYSHLELSDSAIAAKIFHSSGTTIDTLNQARVGKLLIDRHWDDELRFCCQKDIYPIVPYLTTEGTLELLT